ncbi:hypothetical protein ACQPYK_02410 [Streptosporangium sp. CA-135522]|uniref:hypothetical protein n=1 Tax=Streptosporangium sp. CA-135522 TaxID=3240072 RepID=UPI003D8FBD60
MTSSSETPDGFVFGIYPGGMIGDDVGGLTQGPADDPRRIIEALSLLQPDGRPFLVRGYVGFADPGDASAPAPDRVEQYTGDGRVLDLVAQYQSRSGDVAGYTDFVRDLVRRHGAHTATLQVTEEPNLPTYDGRHPRVSEALIEGVVAAKDEARRQGMDHLKVGFNTTPLFGPAAGFIASITGAGGRRFLDALDYIGLDFFPDVFQPIPVEQLHDAVIGLLDHHRTQCLTPAGIDEATPLHITENGWPTGPGRTPDHQAHVLETIVQAIAACRTRLNVSGYTHFSLRDADSAVPDIFHQFGLLTDDYTPKPAFTTYRKLIEQIGG